MTYPLKKSGGQSYSEKYKGISAARIAAAKSGIQILRDPAISNRRANELREYWTAVAKITASPDLSPAFKKSECCKLHDLVFRGIR